MHLHALAAALLSALLSMTGHASAGDCDTGGVPGTYLFRLDTGPQTPPASGATIALVFENLPQPYSPAFPYFRAEASADLGLLSERLYVRLNGGDWTELNFNIEGDCTDPPGCTNSGPYLPFFYGQVWTGTLIVEVLASPTVTAETCPNAWIRFYIQYRGLMDDDCDGNRRADWCDIADGTLADCDGNGWADTCQIARFPASDCNGNGRPDCCDTLSGEERDCNRNGVLDSCEIAVQPALDCDVDGLIDDCELQWLIETDLNRNLVPDRCDLASGELEDCNGNGIADLAELIAGANDANRNAVIDVCEQRSPDLDPDGNVGAADLAILLSRWGTSAANADLDANGWVGAPDLSLLLAAWGPIGLCGDGVQGPNENCCNCPQDAGCGGGFDCYYGACLPCYYGNCPPSIDSCSVYYGSSPSPCPGCSNPTYGTDTIPDCYRGLPLDSNQCLGGLFGPARSPRFAMRIIDLADHRVAVASIGFILLLATPRGLLRSAYGRMRQRSPR